MGNVNKLLGSGSTSFLRRLLSTPVLQRMDQSSNPHGKKRRRLARTQIIIFVLHSENQADIGTYPEEDSGHELWLLYEDNGKMRS